MIARIAVASAVFSMDKPFDYRIPDSLTLQPGQRVRVPFGASNRRTEGIVLAVMPDGAERPDGPALKPVEAALDPEPLLSRAALHLAAFVRERYFCTFYDAVRAILPAGVCFSRVTAIPLRRTPHGTTAGAIRRRRPYSKRCRRSAVPRRNPRCAPSLRRRPCSGRCSTCGRKSSSPARRPIAAA